MTDKQVKERFNRNLLICSDSACCSNGNSKEVTMNEIEKMYENTIGKQSYCTANDCLDMSKCKNCYFCKQFYPPFTADKVLKVIVFFLNKEIRLDFSIEENIKISVENFKECIAQIGSKYWQDLTPEEKQQLKEILNDR